MMDGTRAVAEWENLVEQIVGASGTELVKAELLGSGGSRMLRVYIDQPGGVALADCERVSRALSAAFDAHPAALPGGYILEVSSPGVDRPLVKPADFDRFAGQRVQVRTRQPVGTSRRLVGRLQGADAEGVRLLPEPGAEIVIAWDNVTSARLAPLWPSASNVKGRGRSRS